MMLSNISLFTFGFRKKVMNKFPKIPPGDSIGKNPYLPLPVTQLLSLVEWWIQHKGIYAADQSTNALTLSLELERSRDTISVHSCSTSKAL